MYALSYSCAALVRVALVVVSCRGTRVCSVRASFAVFVAYFVDKNLGLPSQGGTPVQLTVMKSWQPDYFSLPNLRNPAPFEHTFKWKRTLPACHISLLLLKRCSRGAFNVSLLVFSFVPSAK